MKKQVYLLLFSILMLLTASKKDKVFSIENAQANIEAKLFNLEKIDD
jgi:hypothetical protein